MFKHALCLYPYLRALKGVGFLPPLGLECIVGVLEPYAEKVQIVDLRKVPGRTRDFILPDTNLVCFSVNWDRDVSFMEEEVRSVPPGVFTLLGKTCY